MMDAKLDIGRVIRQGFSTWFDHFFGFFLLALVLTLPVLPLELAPVLSMGEGSTTTVDMVWLISIVGGFLRVLAGYLLTGIVVFTVFHSLQGQSRSITQSLSTVLENLLSLTGIAIILTLLIGAGLALCFVPGVYLALIFVVAVPALVVERLGVVQALKRSNELTRGNRGEIFGIYIAYFLLYAGILLITFILRLMVSIAFAEGTHISTVSVSTTGLVLMGFLEYGMDALMMPLQATLAAIIYHDLRQIEEERDQGESFEHPQSSSPFAVKQPQQLSNPPQDQEPLW